MVRYYIFIFSLLLFVNTNAKSTSKNEFTKPILETAKQFENTLVQQKFEYIEPYLSKNFVLNDYDSSVSKKLFKSIIFFLEVNKIDSIRIDEVKSDTVFVSTMLNGKKGYFNVKITMLHKTEATKILSIKFGVKLNIKMGVSENDDNEALLVDDLSSYKLIKQEYIHTYYQPGSLDLANSIAKKQYSGSKLTESILGEELSFPLGILLLEKQDKNVVLSKPVIPITINKDFTLDSISLMLSDWVYFHELVELHLIYGKNIKDPETRWFRDGLSDFVAYQICKRNNPKLAKRIFEQRKASYRKLNKSAELLLWTGTGQLLKQQEEQKFECGNYAAALFFFNDFLHEFNDISVSKILASINRKEVSSDNLIHVLKSLAGGEDIKERIKRY